MKTLHKIIVAALLVAVSVAASAQGPKKNCKNDGWKERVEAEKVAFLTSRMNLTPEEAQVFWPVYNETRKECDSVHKEFFTSFKNLKSAVDEGKSEDEIAAALDKYLKASENKCAFKTEQAGKFEKVLPASKVAVFFMSEEDFRKVQFNKSRHHGNNFRRGHGKPAEGCDKCVK